MEKKITYETLRSFCYSSDRLAEGQIRGISIKFSGLGNTEILNEDPEHAKELAQHGIVCVIPYADPWNWMNRKAVAFTDEILDVLFSHYDLPADLPVVSCGGSMGGLCSLTYACYAKRTPVAVVSNCPVCDLVAHYSERPDLPRTLYCAFGGYDAPRLEDALKTASPFHLAASMPKIPYRIYHCGADTAVNIDLHSRRFVEEMRRLGHDISLCVVPDRGHCDLTPDERHRFLVGDIVDAVDRCRSER